MVIWSGYSAEAEEKQLADFGFVRGGGVFEPAKGKWTKPPLAPIDGRSNPSTVWTGREMIVFGGTGYERGAEHGARFDPAANRWTKLPKSSRPFLYGAVEAWDGSRMLLWGGTNQDDNADRPNYADGIAYDPSSNKWSTIPRAPIEARVAACGAWTPHGLVVWGGFGDRTINRNGYSSSEEFSNGAIYNSTTRSWRRIAKGPLVARGRCVAHGTGSKVIIYGGDSPRLELNDYYHTDGAMYDPESDTWTKMPKAPLTQRVGFASVWAGNKLVVWGGVGRPNSSDGTRRWFSDGAAFDPGTGRWSKLPRSPLKPRAHATAVWTGSRIYFWGGSGDKGQFADGASLFVATR